jgi:hypothetical protein
MTRLVAAIGIVSALVLAGGITAGLILAKDQAPPAPVPMASEAVVPAPDAAAETGLTAMPETGTVAVLETGLAAMPEPELAAVLETAPDAVPKPELATMPGPDPAVAPKPELAVMPEPGPKATLVTQMGGPSEGTSSELEGASPGTVYTYQDGDRTLRVVLEPPRQAVKETIADAASEDGVSKKGELDSLTRKQSGPDDGQPVFRSESGGGLMTLPGGIILALDPEWDQAAVEKFFSQNGISLDRTSELDFLVNGFFVETEPGFPSLELANALAGQEGVIISSPNWAREVDLN